MKGMYENRGIEEYGTNRVEVGIYSFTTYSVRALLPIHIIVDYAFPPLFPFYSLCSVPSPLSKLPYQS